MLPVRVGACLKLGEIAPLRDWLFEGARDIELQDFMTHADLTGDWRGRAAEARRLLDGHGGRLGIHGPFEGLAIDSKDPELQPLITARFLTAVAACEALGAVQMVVHSPYTAWYQRNLLTQPRYAERKTERVLAVLGPVVRRAEACGVTLVIENIEDVDPASRALLAEAFGSPAVRLSVDTGHADLARSMSGAPPADIFIRAAGSKLAHVHVQDVDGHADRHWPPGQGRIAWEAVFAAIAEAGSAPHVVLEMRDKATILPGFEWLKARGLAA